VRPIIFFPFEPFQNPVILDHSLFFHQVFCQERGYIDSHAMPIRRSVYLEDTVIVSPAEEIDTTVIDTNNIRRCNRAIGHKRIDLNGSPYATLVDVVGESIGNSLDRAQSLAVDDEDAEIPIIWDIFLQVVGRRPEIIG